MTVILFGAYLETAIMFKFCYCFKLNVVCLYGKIMIV